MSGKELTVLRAKLVSARRVRVARGRGATAEAISAWGLANPYASYSAWRTVLNEALRYRAAYRAGRKNLKRLQ